MSTSKYLFTQQDLESYYKVYQTYLITEEKELDYTKEMAGEGGSGFNSSNYVRCTFGDFVVRLIKNKELKDKWMQQTFNPKGRILTIKFQSPKV